MNKIQKQNSIKLAKDILVNNQMFILMNYKGLNASHVVELRNNLKDKDANMKIIKNTLFKKAVEGTQFAHLNDYFSDQIAISYSKDPICLSNIISKFAKGNENLKIRVASLDGKIVDVGMVEELASLGSRDDVRARFIGVLKAPGSQLARVLMAYKEKLEA
ncbi:MAG: 50S ribosomal protein L10 [Rickettsiales bacterium]|jgi:large subunit ribosomal protein L10|nr:50S ribosomal protein L10 [Rickettsiales bacterium]